MENANRLPSKKRNQTSNQELVNTASINNQTPQVETPTKPVFSRLPYIIFTLFVVVFLSVLAGVFPYNKNTTFKKMNDYKVQITNIGVSPIPTLVNQQPGQRELKQWVLKKKINGGYQTIVSFCRDCHGSYLEYWKEWIFYPEYEYKHNILFNIQIKGYNLKTSEFKIIYDLNQNIKDFQGGGNRFPREVLDMQVIDNTLFFSLGGYLTPGGVFWIDLPPSTKPQKLEDGYGKITYWKNRYWIIGGDGDACWGFMDYSLVDITSKKVTHVATSKMGCVEGEEFIDIDKRERMILSFHTRGWIPPAENGIYQYVIGVPLSNPSVKEEIIAKQNMPSDITTIKYLEESDQLLLLGKEKYLYDLSSKTIKKTEMVFPSPTPKPEIQNYIDDKIKRLSLPNEYKFVLE